MGKVVGSWETCILLERNMVHLDVVHVGGKRAQRSWSWQKWDAWYRLETDVDSDPLSCEEAGKVRCLSCYQCWGSVAHAVVEADLYFEI